MPKISVIIPVYNKEKYIRQTVESVLNQTFSDFELILIDDGSIDNSLNIIKQFNDIRIKYISQTNQGVAAARNNGVATANGELIAFLDADDMWHPHHLQEISFLYKHFPDAGFFATAYEIQFRHKVIKQVIYNFEQKHSLIDKYYRFSKAIHLFYTSNFAVKKTVFNEVSGFKKMHSEDIDLFLTIGTKHKMAYSKVVTMTYTLDAENSLSGKYETEKKIVLAENFKELEKNDVALKEFLDFNRYAWAVEFKLDNKESEAQKLIKQINFNNLTFTQRFLIKRSVKQLQFLKKIQRSLKKYNIHMRASSS